MRALGVRWPRGTAKAIRLLRRGGIYPRAVARETGCPIGAVRLLRSRLREVQKDRRGSVIIPFALALPVLIVGALGTLRIAEGMVDQRMAQGCADSAALAAAINGCPVGVRFGTANGCEAQCSGGPPFSVTATHGIASAFATAAANPVRLLR